VATPGGGGTDPGPLPVKRSVALVIRGGGDGRRVLAVRRPPDDEELPDVWGLPAASLRAGETWLDAVVRAGREKLGVRVAPGALLREGRTHRAVYELAMRLYEARIVEGEPAVGGVASPSATRYVDWRWGEPSLLAPAAERGSLCARIYLEAEAGAPHHPV
jgi:ADP-ribose pyrophosphatase YjhB (NUDIX family)